MKITKNDKYLKLSNIADKIPEFFVLTIDKIANKLIEQGRDIIKLNLGKSELPMPKYVEDEMVDKMTDSVKRELIDSQGLLSLREEIVRHYNENNKAGISAKQVFINNGTSPFFQALFLLLVNEGEEILFPKPYYPTYVASAKIAKAKCKFYEIENGKVKIEDIKNNFIPGKTKIVFLNSPGNPLGNVNSKEELQQILDIVDGRAYVISDEIYDGFVYNNNYNSILDVYNKERDKVIVINGFSKIHHMYTRRLGYAIVPEQLISALIKYQQHTLVCVDPVTQYGGLISIKNKNRLIEEEINHEVKEYSLRLNDCMESIKKTKLRVMVPEGSFYMCVDVSGYLNEKAPNSLELAKEILDKVNVAVTPGEDFGVDNIFRISLTGIRTVEGVKKMCQYFERK